MNRVLVSLLRELVRCQIVPFPMRGSGCRVGVGCEVMQFCGPIVRALWHGVLPSGKQTWAFGWRVQMGIFDRMFRMMLPGRPADYGRRGKAAPAVARCTVEPMEA
jgi:hypothetical protein